MSSTSQEKKKVQELDLDGLIEKLLSAKKLEIGTELDLKEEEIRRLIFSAKDVFMS